MNPARMCLESLDRRPGIREQNRPKADLAAHSISAEGMRADVGRINLARMGT